MSIHGLSENAAEYWVGKQLDQGHSCPNVSLFRLLGYAGINLSGAKVLEVGFGANRGRDLIECGARGATIFGLDINKSYVDDFTKAFPDVQVQIANIGSDSMRFDTKFDLIFHRDVIYYLSDEQIRFHLSNVFDALNEGGSFLFQFIEHDFFIDKGSVLSYRFNPEVFKFADSSKLYRSESNPIRKLDIDWLISESLCKGFELVATKTLLESYPLDESVCRVERYLLLRKVRVTN
jgi:hypothetical protein